MDFKDKVKLYVGNKFKNTNEDFLKETNEIEKNEGDEVKDIIRKKIEFFENTLQKLLDEAYATHDQIREIARVKGTLAKHRYLLSDIAEFFKSASKTKELLKKLKIHSAQKK